MIYISIIYTCYDPNLKQYFLDNGFRYILCGLSLKEPHKTFWVFERNNQLESLLNKWLSHTR